MPRKNKTISTETKAAPAPRAVALVKSEKGVLRASGAFDRYDAALKGKADAGDLIEVKLSKNSKKATFVRRIGRPDSISAVIEALALNAGELAYSEIEEAAAAASAAAAAHFERRDLRSLVTFTIDGESTRDFDDAISARVEGERIRVWVHVADVAAYVRPGSELDGEARRRATSVYLPTRTIPMLPKALSVGVCSLVPGEERAAVTCELLLERGEVIERQFYRSLIRSDARLTYGHVEDIFLGRTEPGPTYAAALAAARQAAIDRTVEGPDENRFEAIFEISGEGVIGISSRPEEESQRLIERLMVLANQEVARFLSERGVPALFRTHAASDPEKVRRMLSRLRSLGVEVTDPTIAGAVEAIGAYEARHGPNEALMQLVWGARAPASYERELAAHDGLGLHAYTHFTSPIRRYADLVVHRALLAEIGAEEFTDSPRHSQLPELAEHLNERTKTTKKLERRSGDICQVSLLVHRLNSTGPDRVERKLKGRIVGMSAHGCYIRVDCTEGMLQGRSIGGAANEEQTIWSTGSGRELRLGDVVAIRIRKVDPVRGQLALELTGEKGKGRRKRVSSGSNRSKSPKATPKAKSAKGKAPKQRQGASKAASKRRRRTGAAPPASAGASKSRTSPRRRSAAKQPA